MIDTITARDLMKLDLDPPKQVVEGLLTAGLNILAGNPKAGKSFLSLAIAAAVSSGGRALGKIDTKQQGVLYLALEDTRFRLKHRLKATNVDPSPHLHFATSSPRMSDGGIDGIHDWLNEHEGVGLVIVDTLAKISDPKSGNDVYGEDSAMGGALHSLAHAHNIAILVVHHTRKQSHGDFLHTVSGSAGFTGSADTVLVLNRKRNESTATLNVTGRDILEKQFDLTWYSPGGGWIVDQKGAVDFATRRYS